MYNNLIKKYLMVFSCLQINKINEMNSKNSIDLCDRNVFFLSKIERSFYVLEHEKE